MKQLKKIKYWEKDVYPKIDYENDNLRLLSSKEKIRIKLKEFLVMIPWNQRDTYADGSRIPSSLLISQNLSSLKTLVKMPANYFLVQT